MLCFLLVFTHAQSTDNSLAVFAIPKAMSDYNFLVTMQILIIKNGVDSYNVYKGRVRDAVQII